MDRCKQRDPDKDKDGEQSVCVDQFGRSDFSNQQGRAPRVIPPRITPSSKLVTKSRAEVVNMKSPQILQKSQRQPVVVPARFPNRVRNVAAKSSVKQRFASSWSGGAADLPSENTHDYADAYIKSTPPPPTSSWSGGPAVNLSRFP